MTTDAGQRIVDVGACRCPGTPHARDTVTLVPAVTLPMGAAFVSAVNEMVKAGGTQADAVGQSASIFLHLGIEAWTLTDEKHQPVPVTPANVDRLLPWAEGGYEVSEAAEALFGEELIRPLVRKMSRLSPATSMPDSTSQSSPTGDEAPTPSVPSSRRGTGGKLSVVQAQ